MERSPYYKLSEEQIRKVGNALVYFIDALGPISKTKALKLIYLLDEQSIKKSGIPFFNLKYKVWKFGPVSEDIYIDFTSRPALLKGYIDRKSNGEKVLIQTTNTFEDGEFSDNDIALLDFIIEHFGHKSAKELVRHTHKVNSPWYQTAQENGVLELLTNEEINNTELVIDLQALIAHDDHKLSIYQDYVESH